MYNNRARGTRGPRPTTIKNRCIPKDEPESVLHHILFYTQFIIHTVLYRIIMMLHIRGRLPART